MLRIAVFFFFCFLILFLFFFPVFLKLYLEDPDRAARLEVFMAAIESLCDANGISFSNAQKTAERLGFDVDGMYFYVLYFVFCILFCGMRC